MSKWKNYKKTYRNEPDIYDFARLGDFRGLADTLSLNSNLNLDAKNHRGYSPLMLAVYNGHRDFCEALLRSGADVNSTDLMGNTVLMASAFKGNVDIIELLLQFGAITTHKNQANMNVRDWAVMFGRTEAVQYLDNTTPNVVASSKIKNILRFIRLSFIMIKKKTKNRG
ncbi:ankyrin repeat domain-containing protein [Vibrio algarum]|uniref:Protein fem-1 homolog B n=1 Tax=Vibrio algarum TaxID=3020714 RepID=A0ABT4YS22_9VIBR|nr:ankyrin repeat domain-containing protein [Vibrio sp. KJ40-1]MDB1124362.1 ankyrin repeat domain-containing protein [Vibrio sp. KJ40-1]